MKIKKDTSIQIFHFEGKMSKWLTSIITEELNNKGFLIFSHNFEVQTQNNAYSHTFFIFPVLGENRLPKVIEQYLKKPTSVNFGFCHLIVSCDIDPKTNSHYAVPFEFMIRMKSHGAIFSSPPLIVDNPSNLAKEDVIRWVLDEIGNPCKSGHGITFKSEKSVHNINRSLFYKLEMYEGWNKLCRILKRKPLVTKTAFSQDEVRLSFITPSPYPKSLLENLSNKKLDEIWECLNGITIVTEVSLRYAELKNLSYANTFLNRLKSLDLSANAFESFDFLLNCPNIISLNIGACDLKKIPEQISKLKKLSHLFAYKNHISEIPISLKHLKRLSKLSLYRNRLSNIPNWINSLLSLKHLNIGGNPIEFLPEELADLTLEYLGLRNCELDSIPLIVKKLNLKSLDISKNPKILKIPFELKEILEYKEGF